MLDRIANWEDPDQTASSEAVCSGSALFVQAGLEAKSVRNIRTSNVSFRINSLFLIWVCTVCLAGK